MHEPCEEAAPEMAMAVVAPPPVKGLEVHGPPMPVVLVQDWCSLSRLPAHVSGKAPVHSALVDSDMRRVAVNVSTRA